MLLDLVIPARCAACDERGPSPCRACWSLLRRPAYVPIAPPLASLHAPLSYEGPARELVAKLKYRNHRGSMTWLATAMAAALPLSVAADCTITWAPTTDARRRARGFDHAQLLAARVAGELGVRSQPLLGRRAGSPQTGLSPGMRRANRPVFTSLGRVGGCVVVIDDVVTTGTTLRAAGDELRQAGATSVVGLVAAITPLKGSSD